MGPAGTRLPLWIVVWGLALALFVLVRSLWFAWPLDVHLRDDSYYYFCWARSVAAGTGPCVTPGVPTTGVHVLYPVLLSAWAWLFGAAGLPAAGVWGGMTLHVVTAVLVARFCHRSGCSPRAAVLISAAYAGSPYLAGEMIHGQTALACFALAAFVCTFRRGPAWFLAGGLFAVWARSDLIFLIAAAACSEPKERARRAVLLGLVLVGYAAVNFAIAGRWLQDSAEPIPWLMAMEREHQGLRGWDHWGPGLERLALGIRFRLSSTPLSLGFLAAAVYGWWWRRDALWGWMLLGGVALVAFHDLWRGYPRDYYFAPLGTCGALGLGVFTACRPVPGRALAALGLVWIAIHALDPPRTFPWQREMTMAGRVIEEVLPGERALGCFNAGIVTWHRPSTVNLDGVVNRPAFEALRSGQLGAYLQRQGIDFVADNPVQFAMAGIHSNGRYFGGGFDPSESLEECLRFVDPGTLANRGRDGIGWFSLYRIGGRGEPLSAVTAWRRAGLTDLGAMPGGRAIAWSGAPGDALRVGGSPVFEAPEALLYVLFVPWDGSRPLRVSTTGREPRSLTIAPE